MCGFIGFNSKDQSWQNLTIFSSLSAKLSHRGPDDYGIFVSNLSDMQVTSKDLNQPSSTLNLLHHRLSILGLTDAGRQPMASPCGRFILVYNGEIYNYRELAKELETLGHQFRTGTDSEVLLAAFMQWGTDCLPKLSGMYAFAIFDQTAKTITLGRDNFGIKPLFYYLGNAGFAFASEIRPLLELPGIQRQANSQVVFEYLVNGRQENSGKTFFADIHELPPAHFAVYSIEKNAFVEKKAYWQLQTEERTALTKAEAARDIEDIFTNSVKLHMRSDVDICATLSGGIDSSSIVMAIKKALGDEQDVNTISFVARDKKICEEYWIDIVNNASGAKANKVNVEYHNVLNDLDDIIYAQEQPFGSTSPVAQFNVFRKIHELNYKVVLDGQGADEMLGGYRSYLYAYLISLFRQRKYLSSSVLAFNISRLPGVSNSLLHILKHAVSCRKILKLNQSASAVKNTPDWTNLQWFNDKEVLAYPSWAASSNKVLKENLAATFTHFSLPHLLRVQDRNSMHFSIESRVPFLNVDLVNYIFSLPESYLIDLTATTKSVFRHAMQPLVPPEILARKDKIGFSTPEESWLKSHASWVTDTLSSEVANSIPALNSAAMLAEWNKLQAGKTHFCWRYWRMLNLVKWTERFNVTYA